jgi:diacylglycerol kinase (ATP)
VFLPMNMYSNRFSLKSRLRSFRFAFKGLKALIKFEHNSRIHLFAAVAVIVLGLIMKIELSDWSLLIVVIGMVFITELLNSSLESLGDRVNPDFDELIGRAKNYSAAAVFISAIVAIAVGAIIFLPKLWALI